MEPTNHPFRKENDLNQTSMIMFHVNLQGCISVLADDDDDDDDDDEEEEEHDEEQETRFSLFPHF